MFRRVGRVVADDGSRSGHRFDDGDGQAFRLAGQGPNVGGRQQVRNVVAGAEKANPFGHAKVRREFVDLGCQWPISDKNQVPVVVGREGRGPDQIEVTLADIKSGHRHHDPATASDAASRLGVARSGGGESLEVDAILDERDRAQPGCFEEVEDCL